MLHVFDRLRFLGGRGDALSSGQEGLAAALEIFEGLEQSRGRDVVTTKHVLYLCNSPCYEMPIIENVMFNGKTLDELAALLVEKKVNVSVFAPRKLPFFYKLYEKCGGDLAAAKEKNYAWEPRHLVLLRGFGLQERPITPKPALSNTAPPLQQPNTTAPQGGPQQGLNPGMVGQQVRPPGPPGPGQFRPSGPQQQAGGQAPASLPGQAPLLTGILNKQQPPAQRNATLAGLLNQPPQINPGMGIRGPGVQQQGGMQTPGMPPGPMQQPQTNMPQQGGMQSGMNQVGMNQGMQQQSMPPGAMGQGGMQQGNMPQGGGVAQGMQQGNMPQGGIQPGMQQQNMQQGPQGMQQQGGGMPGAGQGALGGRPGAPGDRPREREMIWKGELEWQEKVKDGPGDQKISHSVACTVSTSKENGVPEVKPDNWPNKLIMQLIPKTLVQTIGGEYFRNSKSVLFHPSDCESLEALTKVMGTGFAGCVHFTGPCDIKVLILLYSNDKKAYLGFIPNDQTSFVDRIRTVIQRQKMGQQQQQQPGRPMGMGGPMGPGPGMQMGMQQQQQQQGMMGGQGMMMGAQGMAPQQGMMGQRMMMGPGAMGQQQIIRSGPGMGAQTQYVRMSGGPQQAMGPGGQRMMSGGPGQQQGMTPGLRQILQQQPGMMGGQQGGGVMMQGQGMGGQQGMMMQQQRPGMQGGMAGGMMPQGGQGQAMGGQQQNDPMLRELLN